MNIRYPLFFLLFGIISSCNEKGSENKPAEGVTASETTEVKQLANLPPFVVYKDWEIGAEQKKELVLNLYRAWDGPVASNLSSYFGDTVRFDLPDGRRIAIPNKDIESTIIKWRKSYKETSNIPFSLISLHNKDLDQDWVIAWTWNKWSYTDGKKDSMLYCDNWRIKDGKVVYLNSLENSPSRSLSKALNKLPKE